HARAPGAPAAPAAAAVPVAEAIVAEVRRHTARFADIAQARAEGFVQASGMQARHGYHFLNARAGVVAALGAVAGRLDLAAPPMLLYVEDGGLWRLVGVEYVLPEPPADDPFPGAAWHRHDAACHYRDSREVAAPRARDCPPRHPASGAGFLLWHPAFAVAHVWAWSDNPLGPFAAENPALAAYGGAAAHGHGRNPAHAVYSELSHRAAGAILLLLAGLVAWETRRPRPLPWSVLPAAVWIAFGLYLAASADPESWPWGPRPFAEIFADPLVLQHKLLALIPLAIGVLGALRAAGRLAPAATRRVLGALGVLGGLSLFLHFHEGRLHVDGVYLQHAAMGLTALGLGATLLAVRGGRRGQTAARWAWPGFLALMAVLLLLYVER
ncbi:MAG TPA: hypothetical protein VFX28_12745, partial [Methylomirabilota bacterium]|nr:hypothetical protein [Methylomirabilota bacterium]